MSRTHSFRKTVATLIDDEGLSARIGADHLGHSHVGMTQDRYMSRGRIHTQVADLLDRAVSGFDGESGQRPSGNLGITEIRTDPISVNFGNWFAMR
jgi:hypothetical protein